MKDDMGEFPSGQRGQTVNLLRHASVVRIHLLPPSERIRLNLRLGGFLFGFFLNSYGSPINQLFVNSWGTHE